MILAYLGRDSFFIQPSAPGQVSCSTRKYFVFSLVGPTLEFWYMDYTGFYLRAERQIMITNLYANFMKPAQIVTCVQELPSQERIKGVTKWSFQ